MSFFEKILSKNSIVKDQSVPNSDQNSYVDALQIQNTIRSGVFYKDSPDSTILNLIKSFCDNNADEDLSVIYVACYAPTLDVKIGSCTSLKHLVQRISDLGFVKHNNILKDGTSLGLIFLPSVLTGKKIRKGRYYRDQYLSDRIEFGFHRADDGMAARVTFAKSKISPFGISSGYSEWYHFTGNNVEDFKNVTIEMERLEKFVTNRLNKHNDENQTNLEIIPKITINN